MINKSKIILPSDDEDIKLVLSKACDMYTKAYNTSAPFFTRFLSPLESATILGRFPKNEMVIRLFGGFEDAERAICAFSVHDDYIAYPIAALRVRPKDKNATLSHRDYMGSVLSLGIKRELVGDIVVDDGGAFIFCMEEIADYIIQNLPKVGGTGVVITRENNPDAIDVQRSYDIISSTVSSMRCDSLAAACTKLARGKASELIEKGLVTLNYEIIKTPHKPIEDGDVISIRGYGKFKIQTDGHLTKKGRIHVNILKFI